MKQNVCAVSVALLAASFSWGQPAAAPDFEVASVKPSAPSAPWRESKAGADRIDFPKATLRYCIAYAYGLKGVSDLRTLLARRTAVRHRGQGSRGDAPRPTSGHDAGTAGAAVQARGAHRDERVQRVRPDRGQERAEAEGFAAGARRRIGGCQVRDEHVSLGSGAPGSEKWKYDCAGEYAGADAGAVP